MAREKAEYDRANRWNDLFGRLRGVRDLCASDAFLDKIEEALTLLEAAP